jgi:hypothetical protein
MKYLLVISNHNPDKWSENQKQGWDRIEFHPFPNIPADISSAEVIENFATPICQKIGEFYSKCDEQGADGYVTIQGEFSLCKAVFDALHGEDVRFVFPTTERKVVETQNPDGTTTKTAIFEFVQWREM